MRIWLAPAATLFVLNAVAGMALAQEATDPQPARPPRELLQPPKKGLEASPITDRFALRVSYYQSSIDTFLRLDRSTGQAGTNLQVENDLGLDDKASMARMEMIFIRAPRIVRTGPGVSILATHGGDPVLVREGRLLAATFHPEMSADRVLHEHFAAMAAAPPAGGRPI